MIRWVGAILIWSACAAMVPQGIAAEPAAGTNSGSATQSVLDQPLSNAWNHSLPKWLRITGEIRNRVENRTAFGYKADNNDGYDLNRLRLNIEVRPTSWIQMFVQGQDSRAFGIAPVRSAAPYQDTFDLHQAYVRFRNREDSPISLTVGRQELIFGAQRLVGNADWLNAPRSFDAAKLELGNSKARVNLFAASVVVTDPGHIDHHQDGNNFFGGYGALNSVIPASTLEPFLFYRTLRRVTGEQGIGNERGYTSGVRLASKPGAKALHNFDYTLDAAEQWGRFAHDSVSAWAGAAVVGYTTPFPWTPRVSAEWAFASGDKDRHDGTHGTFDNLYPTNHAYYGLADRVGWQNIRNLRLGNEFKPKARWRVATDYHWFWLASRYDNLYDAALTVAVRTPAGGARHTDVGQELDLSVWYAISKQIALGSGVGHLFPGLYLKENSPGSRTTYSYIFAGYKF